MRFRFLFLLGLTLLPVFASGQLSFGSAQLLNDSWRFSLHDVEDARQATFDDSSWQTVQLPHDWSVKGTLNPDLASCTGYLPGGVGWYRKTVRIPASAAGGRVYLYFEGVYNRSEVYLNGKLLGKRPNGYVSFYYDATDHVLFDRDNTIAVRVDHSRSADSRWYTGSGIYRNVYLIRSGAVHLAPWGLVVRSKEVSKEAATVVVDAEIKNEGTEPVNVTVEHVLLTQDGMIAASTRTALSLPPASSQSQRGVLQVKAPHLWSVTDPYLYRLRTSVVLGDRVVDHTFTNTGIRTFAFDANKGFFLNGVGMKMKGVCLHHDAGVLGAAVPRDVWRKRLLTLKAIGCNAVRTSHNPQAPDFYELCDELGLLVMNEAFDEWEFPKRKWLRGWNVGKPGFEGSNDFFGEWAERDLADMVRRDRNHPSIFAWSIGNEVDYPNDPYSHPVLDGTTISQPMFGGYKPEQPDATRLGAIAHRLAAVVRKHDPSRPVTAALAGVVMSNATEYPSALDIVGYNYTEDRYEADHLRYPQRVLYGSENRHSYDVWKLVVEKDYIFGQFLWTGIDYLGESGPWPSRGFYSGLVDLSGAVKPRGRFRESLWSDKPVIHLGTERLERDNKKSIDAWPRWDYRPGERVRVFCYSNAARVRLLLNGKAVGDPKPRDTDTGVLDWEVPFQPGKLEAEGLDEGGGLVARTAIETSGPASSMRLAVDDTAFRREGGVVAVELQIVDAKGAPVFGAENEIRCEIQGAARLLGLEAGNNEDMSDYTDAVHRAFHGRLVAYVQNDGRSGQARVRFSSGSLPAAEIELTAP